MKSTTKKQRSNRWEPIWRTLTDSKLWYLGLIAEFEFLFMRELVWIVGHDYPKPDSLLLNFIYPVRLCYILLPPFLFVIVFGVRKIWRADPNQPTSLVATLLRVARSDVSSSVYGFMVLLFWGFNLSWASSLLLDAIRGKESWTFFWIIVPFVIMPFLLPSTPKKSSSKVPAGERKVLITALSIPKNYGTDEYDASKVKSDTDHPGWLGNWVPIHKCLTDYTKIERVYLVVSKQAIKFLEDLPQEVKPINELLKTEFTNIADVVEIYSKDVFKFNDMYESLKNNIEAELKKDKIDNREMLFSITSGTAVQSVALAFIAMNSDRGCVYSRQDMPFDAPKLEEVEVDIYTIRELWKEIMDQLAPAP